MDSNLFKDKNIIVFGASGYVGNSLKNKILNKLNCTFVSRNSSKDLKINICNRNDYEKLSINSKTILILLVAISSPDLCTNKYDDSFLINVDSTANLIDYTLSKNGKVIFFSSDVVYGDQDVIFNEESNCNPIGAYGKMKREIEEKYINNKNVKIIRPSYIYSSHDKFSKYLFSCAEESKKAIIFHPLYRHIVYLGDVLEGIIKLIEIWDSFEFNLINFGGEDLLSRKDIALVYKNELINSLEFEIEKPPVNFYQSRPISIRIDSSRFETLLGRKPFLLRDIVQKSNYINL
tara:strand:+ start:1035 stop:1907 length:873 start_codon:yes stop_codon:yes gene_type:complete